MAIIRVWDIISFDQLGLTMAILGAYKVSKCLRYGHTLNPKPETLNPKP